ncbi:SNF1-related protein kinase regulatory subunit beta-1 [Forsythia ovata]|uniref:SNF1-related protein kinase regulatory subunit beta-1 n=1 Tax=Forsythia ovata TaxID=205694 RepID=A0ABD1U614_9LAMI
MENTTGREGGGAASENSNHAPTSRIGSADLMASSPPPNRRPSVVPLQRGDGPPFLNQVRQNESWGAVDHPIQQGIPTLITWSYGGNNVVVEGSWDNWRTRKILQRSGKDHSILMVLPSGIYHYKFIVDGEVKYSPDLPCEADQTGCVCCNLKI